MTQDQLLTFYAKLNEKEKVLFLLELAHNLTVVARGAYFQGHVQDPTKLMKANEFQNAYPGVPGRQDLVPLQQENHESRTLYPRLSDAKS
jgi:hypothetical protein